MPTLTYAVPALVQQYRGLGLRRCMATTATDTGRRPVLFVELAAWPATVGGRRGTGEGCHLARAIATDIARDGAILVCTARTATVAGKYRTRHGRGRLAAQCTKTALAVGQAIDTISPCDGRDSVRWITRSARAS